MASMPLLLLFDVDGTLLQGSDEPHFAAMRRALEEVFGVPRVDDSDVAKQGRTDFAIARDVATRMGVEAARYDARRRDVAAAWSAAFAALAPPSMEHMTPDGLQEALAALVADGQTTLTLVTGNLRRIAATKLARAGLDGLFARELGAYGSDAEDRAALPPLARSRAGGSGDPWPRDLTLLIGDTPRDIDCAHADGLRCVAVTTGHYSSAELTAADAVADTPAEMVAAVRALTAGDASAGSPSGRMPPPVGR